MPSFTSTALALTGLLHAASAAKTQLGVFNYCPFPVYRTITYKNQTISSAIVKPVIPTDGNNGGFTPMGDFTPMGADTPIASVAITKEQNYNATTPKLVMSLMSDETSGYDYFTVNDVNGEAFPANAGVQNVKPPALPVAISASPPSGQASENQTLANQSTTNQTPATSQLISSSQTLTSQISPSQTSASQTSASQTSASQTSASQTPVKREASAIITPAQPSPTAAILSAKDFPPLPTVASGASKVIRFVNPGDQAATPTATTEVVLPPKPNYADEKSGWVLSNTDGLFKDHVYVANGQIHRYQTGFYGLRVCSHM